MKFGLMDNSKKYIDSLAEEFGEPEPIQMELQNVYMDLHGKFHELPNETNVIGLWIFDGQFFKPPML